MHLIRRITLLFLVFIITFAVGTFGSTVVRAFFYAPDPEIEVPQEKAIVTDVVSPPTRLRIPALGIDALIQDVGINSKGNMATPSNFTDVGWYKHGVSPGARGSAVIAGHVNNGLGLSGVFERLGELQVGDDIYVQREDGSEVHFVVASARRYPYDDAPEEIIFNPSGSVRLNLITCEGKWLQENKTYDQRLVIFAKLAGE